MSDIRPSAAPAPMATAPQRKDNAGFLERLSVPQKIGLLTLGLAIPGALGLGNILVNQIKEAQVNQSAIRTFDEIIHLSETQDALGFAYLNYATQNKQADLMALHEEGMKNANELIADLNSLGLTDSAKKVQDSVQAWDPVFRKAIEGGVDAKVVAPAAEKIFLKDLPESYGAISDEARLEDAVQPNTLIRPASELSFFNNFVGPESRGPIGRLSTLLAEAYNAPKQADGSLSPEALTRFRLLYQQSEDARERMTDELALVIDEQENPAEFTAAVQKLEDLMDFAFGFANKNLVQSNRPAQPLTDYLARLPELDQNFNDTFQQGLELQKNYHVERAAAFRNRAILIGLLLTAAVLALAWLAFRIIRAITRPLETLTASAQQLAKGNFGTRAHVTARDELGVLASSFNAAADQLQENERRVAQERLEQEQLQNNIGQFLDVTMDIAEGDLTKRGIVTEDILGNVVDSINLMTEELASVLSDTRQAALSVGSGSQQMLSSTDAIRSGTLQTTQTAQVVADQTRTVTEQIESMARTAQASAQAARRALEASLQGQQAVEETLSGMENIRNSSQATTERMQDLAQRSKEIGNIVDTISQIASQTNLLSLHASIEAAGAGEAGERFSVVADEVRELADQSAQAATQVTNLIAGIQREIAELTTTVRESTEQVNQGYQVAGTAGSSLEQIGELSRESARLAEQISLATRDQVQSVQNVNAAVQEIASTAEQSQRSVDQGRAAAEQLQQLTARLTESLSRFRLPNS